MNDWEKKFMFIYLLIIEQMKLVLSAFLMIVFLLGISQSTNMKQTNFCNSLSKVFLLGRNDNFSSYDGTTVKKSAFLVVPGYSVTLEDFAINYADKDNRFIARANTNLDSVSALAKLEELKYKVGACLDSTQWEKWILSDGNDAATPFFKELKQAKAVTHDFTLTLAMVCVATNLYSVNMYVKRRW